MLNSNFSTIQFFLISIIPVLFAIILHEVAHGWAAYKLGDRTAMMLGRLSLNPIKHIDPVGTIIVPALLYLSNVGFLFGWAKPVPIDWRNLKNPKRDTALVALAGPAANLAMALIWVVITAIATQLPASMSFSEVLLNMAEIGVYINILLMVFNLIPIPPTDGGRIAVSLLPPAIGLPLSKLEPFGFIIIVLLLITGILWAVILPIIMVITQLLFSLIGL